MKSKNLVKKRLLNFVKDEISKGRYPGRIELEKRFHIDIRSYFPFAIREVYESVGVDYKTVKEEIVKNRVKLAVQKRRRFPDKEQGRKAICRYIRYNVKRGFYPRYTDVDRHLKINVISYFRTLREAYEAAGIEYPRSLEKMYEDRKKMGKKILNFVSNEVSKDNYPKAKKMEKIFKIQLVTYFPRGIIEVYSSIGIDYYKIREKRLQKIKSRFGSIEKGREEITKFIIKNAKHGRCVGHREITERLKLNLNKYFSGIKEAYDYVGIEYRKDPNPLISIEKQEKLRKISLAILKKLGFKIINERGINEDICVKDKEGNIIPVELKAYRHNLFFPNRLPYLTKNTKNEIEQVRRYMKKYNSPYGIIFTTTDKIKIGIPKDVKLFKATDIFEFLQRSNLENFIRDFNWIRNTYTSESKNIKINEIRERVLEFFKNEYKKGRKPTIHTIQEEFNIDIRTYFLGTMREIYQNCNIPPLRRLKEKARVEKTTSLSPFLSYPV